MLMYKQNLYLQKVIVIFIKRVNQAPLLMSKCSEKVPYNDAFVKCLLINSYSFILHCKPHPANN